MAIKAGCYRYSPRGFCRGHRSVYVLFNNTETFPDARRFLRLLLAPRSGLGRNGMSQIGPLTIPRAPSSMRRTSP